MLLLNYKPVLHQPTGIGVYANAVLPAFQPFEHVLVPGGGSGGGNERLKRFGWCQYQLPRLARKWKADLIFTPAPEGYLGDQVVPQVLMVHDLRPLTHPELSSQSLYFKLWVPPLLRQSRHILTNSSFTASEICKSIGVAEEKISVSSLGFDADHFYPKEMYKRLYHRPYLLHLGQAYPHKNIYRLIQAFGAISSLFPDVDLVLLGKPHPIETKRLKQLVSCLGLRERVLFKSYVPYEELPDWYRGALAFVYPSLWEGFGLPILEAMACECPVITSYGSGMEEVAAGFARLVEPTDLGDLAANITALLREPKSISYISALQRARYHALSFSWTKVIKKTESTIHRLTG